MNPLIEQASRAAASLLAVDADTVNGVLTDVADALISETAAILAANADDLQRMAPENPKYDRLQLSPQRLRDMADDLRQVATLPSPLGHTLLETTRPNGIRIRKISVPFGLIGIIYEARPNVTVDVFSLCLKSGNACLLKGGSDAYRSNCALVEIIRRALIRHQMNPALCTLLPTGREATEELLQAVDHVNLVIPRGSKDLIDYVRRHALVPVIETGAGVCHTYFDSEGDALTGRNLIFNAKTRRVSVCNALDCLIVHHSRLSDLPFLCAPLAEKEVTIYADEEALGALRGRYPYLLPTTEESFGTEFLDYKMSVRSVASLDEALAHIARYGSRHSECIVSRSPEAIQCFQRQVDAACVYANVSTAFTDGAQFGFGAEIGISTQKLHARGPMGLPELTTYKYVIEGDGQVRG
jgi:glutamate-5-semialdehyde dehydrogenase